MTSMPHGLASKTTQSTFAGKTLWLRTSLRSKAFVPANDSPCSKKSSTCPDKTQLALLISVQRLRRHNFVSHIVVLWNRITAQHRDSQLDQPRSVRLRFMRNAANQRALPGTHLFECIWDAVLPDHGNIVLASILTRCVQHAQRT